jgi:outer membrane protein
MRSKLQALALACAAVACGTASAQSNVVQVGISEYTTHERSSGITGPGIPPGANADVGNGTTLLLTYERLLTPNLGIEFVIGVPPRLKATGTGSVAFLGEVLSAKNVAPTAFVNYHFGQPGDTWRPFAGVGINYTRFDDAKSPVFPKVELGDSTGWAVHAGTDYNINKEWALWASVSALQVKTKVVATGATVIQSTVDLRPIVYSAGVGYRF